jgi:DNA repair exonuclease SbcCD ATPase subunit
MKKFVSIIMTGMLIVGQFPGVCLAKITPKDKESKVIIIKKGDTLGELAKEYLGDANKWPEFKKYNTFDNPSMIYIGEKLAIGYEEAKEMAEDLNKVLDQLRAQMKVLEKELTTQKITILEELKEKESITEAERKELENKLALQKTTLEGLDSTTEAGQKAIKDALAKKETDIATLDAKMEMLNKKINMLEKASEELSVGLKAVETASPEEVARLKEEVEFLGEQDKLIVEGMTYLDERLTGAEAEIEKLKPKKRTALSNLFILAGFSVISYFLTTTE